jgi:predicted N-acetyltransferase YhbS
MLNTRPEGPADTGAIGDTIRQAFGRDNEATLVAPLPRRNLLTTSLVTIQKNEIVGHLTFSLFTLA